MSAQTSAVTAAPVVVIDVAGSVSLSSTAPQVGTEVTATLIDSNGGITNEAWQWRRSLDGGTTWNDIPGATTRSYTPLSADIGRLLRARVTYDDAHGTGKSAMSLQTSAVTAAPVVVIDVAGSVSLSSPTPQVGTEVTATLIDSNGGITNEAWQWRRSLDGGTTWNDIPGAMTSSYTPVVGDLGYQL